jgi:peptidoglycan/LPS O-acetylase OafA/YrhL
MHGLLSERSLASQVLSLRLFQVLDQSSYSFYLIHIGVIQLFLRNRLTNNIIFFFYLNLLTIQLYKWVEHPLQQLLTRAIHPVGLRAHQFKAPVD